MGAPSLQAAVDALKAGRAVVFPTDTVCGLGVAVRFAEGLQEIYELKQRPAGKPVAWLVGSVDDLDRYGADITPQARELVEEGWPGGLTVIVKASAEVPPAFQSAQGTIGLRMPASQTVLALVREVGPLATSSANRAGEDAPRTLAEVNPALIVEAAACVQSEEQGSGIASAVVDASGPHPLVLRRS